MPPAQPPTLDYAKPRTIRPGPPSNVGEVVAGFVVGWLLGIVAAGIVDNVYIGPYGGRLDDEYLIIAFGIVVEAPVLIVLKALIGPRVNGWVALGFGLACGPLVLGAMIMAG